MSDIVIKDESGNILDHFYQWDMNRVISFHAVGMPSSFNVHYANKCSKHALVVNPDTSGEYPTAQVPNLILQNSDPLYIYIYDIANQAYKTEFTVRLPVIPRAKPSDHQYVENISYDTVATLRAEISRDFVHKDGDKVLSDNNFSDTYMNKLDDIPAPSNILTKANKGAANGVAPLNGSALIDSTYLPSYVDDVVEGYLYNGSFYRDSSHTQRITGESGKIYINLSNDRSYRYSGTSFVEVSSTDMTAMTNNEIDEAIASA